jgi:hypothetical protein
MEPATDGCAPETMTCYSIGYYTANDLPFLGNAARTLPRWTATLPPSWRKHGRTRFISTPRRPIVWITNWTLAPCPRFGIAWPSTAYPARYYFQRRALSCIVGLEIPAHHPARHEFLDDCAAGSLPVFPWSTPDSWAKTSESQMTIIRMPTSATAKYF